MTEIIGSPDRAPAGSPRIGDAQRVGETLTAEIAHITDGNGLGGATFQYQWERVDADGASNPTNIDGATSQTYNLVEGDRGKRVRVKVTIRDDACYEAAVTSTASGEITRAVNVPAVGLIVSGTTKVGETLTAETAHITDGNGLTNPVYSFRWERVDAGGVSNRVVLSGQTSRTYTLVNADRGKRVRATASFTDNDGYSETLGVLSDEIASADNVSATGTVNISGTVQVGETLEVGVADVADGNGLTSPVYAYQWERMNAEGTFVLEAISGATSQTYTLVEDDQGGQMRITVSFVDDSDNFEVLRALSGVVAPEDNVAATGQVGVTGRTRVGETLTAVVSGIRDANGLTDPVFAFQWSRVDADGAANPEEIAGATSQTYTLVEDDQGKRLRVAVVFADDDGNTETLRGLSQVVPVLSDGEGVRAETLSTVLTSFSLKMAEQVFGALKQRLEAARPSLEAAPAQRVTTSFAGRSIGWDPESGGWRTDVNGATGDSVWRETGASMLHALGTQSVRDLLDGSSLRISEAGADGRRATLWGQVGFGSYSGEGGDLELGGSVRTANLGADWSSGPWLLGVAVAHSVGDSEYRGLDEGVSESSLAGYFPYVRYAFSERNSIWATAGGGEGSLEITPAGGAEVETSIGLLMGASGLRYELLETEGSVPGLSLAMKADANFINVTSKAVLDEFDAASADSSRVRVALEGSRRIALESGATLIPVAEFGARHDSSSVSAGTGAEVGAGVAYDSPGTGISFDLRGRSLVAHEDRNAQDWGVTGMVGFDADPHTDRGVATSLDMGYGRAQASGRVDALFGLDRMEDLGTDGESLPGGRLNAEVGYGLQAFGNRYTSTPSARLDLAETGPDWRFGWWLTPARAGTLNLSGGVDLDPADEEYGIEIRFEARF